MCNTMGKAQVAGCAGGAGERTEQACSHHQSGHCRTSWEERKELLAGLAKWLVDRSENRELGASVLLVWRNRCMTWCLHVPRCAAPWVLLQEEGRREPANPLALFTFCSVTVHHGYMKLGLWGLLLAQRTWVEGRGEICAEWRVDKLQYLKCAQLTESKPYCLCKFVLLQKAQTHLCNFESFWYSWHNGSDGTGIVAVNTFIWRPPVLSRCCSSMIASLQIFQWLCTIEFKLIVHLWNN